MKKKNQSANGRYISVEKLQKALSNICLEVAEGNERLRVNKSHRGIVIHANGGTVNIHLMEKEASYEGICRTNYPFAMPHYRQ